MAVTKTEIGEVQRRQGAPERARESFEQALALAERSKDNDARALALSRQGDFLYSQGNLDEAKAQLEASLALDQLQKNPRNRERMARTLNRLGLLYYTPGARPIALWNAPGGVFPFTAFWATELEWRRR